MTSAMNRTIYPVALVLIALSGCSGRKAHDSSSEDSRSAWTTLCGDERLPCDERLAIANRNGVMVRIWPENEKWELNPIRQRPDHLAPPDKLAEPVLMLPADAGHCCDMPNAYPLSRLQVGISGAPFLTTVNYWPVVACEITMRDWMSCGVGIEVGGKFVEIHFSPEAKRVPTQREIWDLASLIDEKVRSGTLH